MQKYFRQSIFYLAIIITAGFWLAISTHDAKAYAYTAAATAPVKTYAAPTAFGAVSWTYDGSRRFLERLDDGN